MTMTDSEYINSFFTEPYPLLPTPIGRDFSHSLSLGC